MSRLVLERGHGLVLHCPPHRIAVQDAAELLRGVLLFLQERRACEADHAGVRQNRLHQGVGAAVLAAVGLVNQYEHVRAGDFKLLARDRLELIDDGGDDLRALRCQQIQQVTPVPGLHGPHTRVLESVRDLVVEVDSVGDQHDARCEGVRQVGQGAGQHHHRQALAAASGVPDHTSVPLAVRSALLHTAHDLQHRVKLLVARRFLHTRVEHDKAANERQEAGRRQQGADQLILCARHTWAFLPGMVQLGAERFFPPAQNAAAHIRGQRLSQQRRKGRRHLRVFLAPAGPVLCICAGRAVLRGVLRDGQQQLRERVQQRDFLAGMVAERLRDRLTRRVIHVRALALDDHQRNPVTEQHDVWPARAAAACPLYLEFFRDVPDVVFGRLPVNELDAEALAVAVYRLLYRHTQRQQVIRRLSRRVLRLKGQREQRVCRLLQSIGREFALLVQIPHPVEPRQRFKQHVRQNHLPAPPTPLVQSFSGRQEGVAQIDQQPQGRQLAGHDFAEVGGRIGAGHGYLRSGEGRCARCAVTLLVLFTAAARTRFIRANLAPLTANGFSG